MFWWLTVSQDVCSSWRGRHGGVYRLGACSRGSSYVGRLGSRAQLGARVSIPNNPLLLVRPQSPSLHSLQRATDDGGRGGGAPCSHTRSCGGGEAETGGHLIG